MADAKPSRGRTKVRSENKPEVAEVTPEIANPECEKKCPFSDVKTIIEWMSVVDDFRIMDHKNMLPRWAFAMLALVFFAF